MPFSAQAKLLHGHAFLDDLQSLDPGLYKNLIFVKHYDGDVEDLCLTFAGAKNTFWGRHFLVKGNDLLPRQAWDSQTQRKAQRIDAVAVFCGVDEEMFGMSSTVDLKPGGRAFTVNNQVRKRLFCAV